MDKNALDLLEPALESFLSEFADVAIAPTRRLIAAYLRGQLGPLRRKSILPMAQEAGIAPRTLQELLSLHRWDENLLIQRLQQHVLRTQVGDDSVVTLLETSHQKKGTRTPGVERQRCEPGRRLRNCVKVLHLGYSGGGLNCLLDNAVYLPRCWTDSPEKRTAARIPPELDYRTRRQIALEMVDCAHTNGFRFRWIYCGIDLAYDDQFVEEIRSRGYGVVSARPFRLNGTTLSRHAGSWTPNDFEGFSPAAVLRAAHIGEDALEAFEFFRREIGLDHFEVRTYPSLVRHFALSSASILFLAKQGLRVPPRQQPPAAISRAL